MILFCFCIFAISIILVAIFTILVVPFWCNDPIPSKLFKIHRKLVSATPRFLAVFVAIQANVPLGSRFHRIDILHLHLQVGREFSVGADLNDFRRSTVAAIVDFQCHSQIVPRVFEPLVDHAFDLDCHPGSVSPDESGMLRHQGRTQQRPAAAPTALEDPLKCQGHDVVRFFWVVRLFVGRIDNVNNVFACLTAPYPQGKFGVLYVMVDYLVGELEVKDVVGVHCVAELFICNRFEEIQNIIGVKLRTKWKTKVGRVSDFTWIFFNSSAAFFFFFFIVRTCALFNTYSFINGSALSRGLFISYINTFDALAISYRSLSFSPLLYNI